jgi:DNA-binding CsgD family transcriptional regulator
MPTFTPREVAVVRRLLMGESAKEIAVSLGISPRTVEAHLVNIKIKAGARNSMHLVAKIVREALLLPYDRRRSAQSSQYAGPDRRHQ